MESNKDKNRSYMKRTYQKPVMEIDDMILMPQVICGSGGSSGGGGSDFSGIGGSGSAGGGR